MHVRMPALVAASLALLLPLQAQAAKKPARVIPAPLAVVVPQGETVQLSALALTKKKQIIRNARIRWRSSRRPVATVDRTGLLTAVGRGRTVITARVGGKRARIPVQVVSATTTAGLGRLGHVIADDEAVYWTENNSQVVRVRKMVKETGAILDLAQEPFEGETGLRTTYLDLRQAGGRLFWSSLVEGFERHTAILTVPKDGGLRETAVPFDTGYRIMVASSWGTSGKYLVALLTLPQSVKPYLPSNTRLAALDTETGVWRPLIRGLFQAGEGFVTAGDDKFVYVRARTPSDEILTLRVDPSLGANEYEVLLNEGGGDRFGELGASDGTFLYYWAFPASNDARLMRLPASGGQAPEELAVTAFGTGLATDGANLYWVRTSGALLSMPVTGGPTQRLLDRVDPNVSLGGVALDQTSVYAVRTRGASSTILRRNK